MKPIFAAILLITLFSACELTTSKEMTNDKTENFNWLTGNWKRTNDSAPQKTYECWEQANDSLLKGHGFTMIEQDTIWQEFIDLAYKNGKWKFMVKKQNDSISTDFELSQMDSLSFTSFNSENDYPTHIRYIRENDNLNALIWKDSISIPFNFVKVN